ncbi:sirohydrochlorin chelatase [Jhaorihella thermophila]|uniref:sirohydrochlorin chelatase n=1 Tax=Jhaorihella thermophila TaxID=488547 RepID=UPI000CDED0FC|nr:CbiX/SirB N-terminal domain-containing protein [Jhaorihella thermophila]
MSGTRSPSPKAQVTEALIVAHGQPSAPEKPEAALAGLAARVAEHLPGWRVRSATMASGDRLEREAAAMAGGGLVYPFFMAAGWFASRVLPRRIGRTDLCVAVPFGLDPGLPGLTATILSEIGSGRIGHVLLAAHGSARGTAAGKAAADFAGRLGGELPDIPLSTGFVEQAPGITEAAAGLGEDAVCLPFFAMPGAHCREDVPEALTRAGFRGRLLPVLGADRRVPALVADALKRAATGAAAA